MLINLKLEIFKRGLSSAQISRHIGINKKTMSMKIHEKTDFTRSEMYKIHQDFFPDVDFFHLFLSDEEKISELTPWSTFLERR